MTLPPPLTNLALAEHLARRFSQFDGVEAVALGGSAASGRTDPASDIDLYVFSAAPIAVAWRAALVAERGSSRLNLDLQFWGPGDEWVDRETGIEVDITYWDMPWIEEQLERVLVRHQPSLGYTTAFWNTIRWARPLFDRSGWFQRLQAKADCPYPEALRCAIIAFNHPVLRSVIPAYAHQIELAFQRGDLVSLNHRLAAFLSSYFEVVFALNREPIPGEKRLLTLTAERCKKTPTGMAADITALLQASAGSDPRLLTLLHQLIDRLDQLLLAEGFSPPPNPGP